MADKFAGQSAVNTGDSTGIGLATAKRFVQEGMDHVFITGRRKDALKEIGKGVTAVHGDVASLSDLDRLYDVKGFPAISVYSATKAVIRSFARTWTNELKDRRIRVNTISPGHIDTPIFRHLATGRCADKDERGPRENSSPGQIGRSR
jgi:NAD(P)-dependent dehydrogenase (short-subunit alcohol dehydrogenase family)